MGCSGGGEGEEHGVDRSRQRFGRDEVNPYGQESSGKAEVVGSLEVGLGGSLEPGQVRHQGGWRFAAVRREEEEKHDVKKSDAQRIRPAHLLRADFDSFGYTDRCPGCSSTLRGISVQPHSPGCRKRME